MIAGQRGVNIPLLLERNGETEHRFGKVGLTDKSGKAIFGMDDKGPTANPEEVEHYLRNLGAQDWGASLNVKVMPRKRKPAKVARAAPANRRRDP